jgi:hypothetical protein
MGKNLLIAIGSAIVGALLLFVLLPKPAPAPPVAGPCKSGEKFCIPVYVIMVGDEYQVQQIANVTVSEGGPIFWELADRNYTFPGNGIDFDTPGKGTAAPKGEFKECAPMPGFNGPNTKFRCTFGGSKGKFPYKVNVDGLGTPKPLDPYIVNGN